MNPAKNWKQWTAWLVTAGILAWLGMTTNFVVAMETLKDAHFAPFIPVVIGVCLIVYLVDSACLVVLFRRFNAPTTLKEILPIKGASYLLNVVNYNAGAASIAYFFRNRKNVPFIESLSSMLWLNFIDVVSLALLMVMAAGLGGDRIDAQTRSTLLTICGGLLVVLLGTLAYWNGGFNFFFFGRLRSWRLFATFRKAKIMDYGAFLSLRVAFVTTYVFSQWFVMPFFNMEAGLDELFIYVPALTFIGTIPLINAAGMGAVQGFMRDFYADFVPGSISSACTVEPSECINGFIDAYSTTTIVSFVLIRVVIGLICVRSVGKDMVDPEEAIADGHSASPTETTV